MKRSRTPTQALYWYVRYHEDDTAVVSYEEYVAVAKEALAGARPEDFEEDYMDERG